MYRYIDDLIDVYSVIGGVVVGSVALTHKQRYNDEHDDNDGYSLQTHLTDQSIFNQIKYRLILKKNLD